MPLDNVLQGANGGAHALRIRGFCTQPSKEGPPFLHDPRRRLKRRAWRLQQPLAGGIDPPARLTKEKPLSACGVSLPDELTKIIGRVRGLRGGGWRGGKRECTFFMRWGSCCLFSRGLLSP